MIRKRKRDGELSWPKQLSFGLRLRKYIWDMPYKQMVTACGREFSVIDHTTAGNAWLWLTVDGLEVFHYILGFENDYLVSQSEKDKVISLSHIGIQHKVGDTIFFRVRWRKIYEERLLRRHTTKLFQVVTHFAPFIRDSPNSGKVLKQRLLFPSVVYMTREQWNRSVWWGSMSQEERTILRRFLADILKCADLAPLVLTFFEIGH